MSQNGELLPNSNIITQLKNFLNDKAIRSHLREPSSEDKVYKDECVYCFDTPFSQDGLFVCCFDFVALCINHVGPYVEKTNHKIFLNIMKRRVKKDDDEEEPKDKIQRLCIKEDKVDITSTYSIRFYPDITVPLPIGSHFDKCLTTICDSIIAHASADLQQRLESGISEWDGGERTIPSGLEDLMQLDFDDSIPYNNWECQETGCDLHENLWLNLTDGSIKCGRFAPMSGVKGNSHAKFHYERTGFPYVLKLGTVENGDADIYSYIDDMPVKDPFLRKHLAHFGLDMDLFKKTEKTTLELELDANMKYEFSAIQEDGAKLQNVYGPGFTGLINLGSSCYINSVIQLLLTVPEFLDAYDKGADQIFSTVKPLDSYNDFNFQTAKLIRSLSSGLYSHELEEPTGTKINGVRPTQFRRIVGKDHIEFSTARQQDAEEYVRHFFDKIDHNIKGTINPVNSFRFKVVTRFQDAASNRVRYTPRDEYLLAIPIPLEQCEHVESRGEFSRRKIQLNKCISKVFSDDFIEDYISPITGDPHGAFQTIKIGSFPDFLVIQLQRFAHSPENFGIKKLDVDIEMGDEIDLSEFKSKGIQPGEQLLPDDDQTEKIEQLVGLGFTRHQAKYSLDRLRGDINQAAEWLFMNAEEVPPELKEDLTQDLAPKEFRDGSGRYQLCGFISHMGNSPHSGHYVTHVKKDNIWYIFNDEKVAISQNPPKSLGYLFLFKRIN